MSKEREVTRIYKWKECQRKEKSQEFIMERMPNEREVTRIYKWKECQRKENPQEFISGKNAKGKRSHKNL